MVKKVVFTSLIVYLLGQVLALAATKKCVGWECQEVECPDGYAVLVPGKGYLPCEKFDDYVNGNESVLKR